MALYGVPSGILYGQNERVDELNERIQSRQFPDKELQPNLSGRPSMSKYDRFPIVGKVAIDGESSKSYELYKPSSNFNPGFGSNDFIFLKIIAICSSEQPLRRFKRSNFPVAIKWKFSKTTAKF